MKLGYMMLMVAVGAMLLFAPVAMAAKGGGGDKGHDKSMVFGKVTAVDGAKITIEAKSKDAAATTKTFTTNSDTKVVAGAKGEEKPAEVKDVTVGAHIAVSLGAGDPPVATKIIIMPAKKK